MKTDIKGKDSFRINCQSTQILIFELEEISETHLFDNVDEKFMLPVS